MVVIVVIVIVIKVYVHMKGNGGPFSQLDDDRNARPLPIQRLQVNSCHHHVLQAMARHHLLNVKGGYQKDSPPVFI